MTPLELLWNGWRSQYVQDAGAHRGADGASVFTQILRSGLTDAQSYIVHRGERVFTILNAFPYICGHQLVVPYRQVPSVEDLDDHEHAELWHTVTTAVRMVKQVYRPQGVNVGINLGQAAGGSVNEHLHVHVVPRWSGDGNFMTAVANARTLPEALDVTCARLTEAWASASEIASDR